MRHVSRRGDYGKGKIPWGQEVDKELVGRRSRPFEGHPAWGNNVLDCDDEWSGDKLGGDGRTKRTPDLAVVFMNREDTLEVIDSLK